VNEPNTASDAHLLGKYVRKRDSEAFQELVRRHTGLVYGTCLRATRNHADAEDVTQECFVELSKHAGEIACSIAGWLHTVATRRSIDLIRRAEVRRRKMKESATLDKQQKDPKWEEVSPYLDEVIEELPERFRIPLVRYYLEGTGQDDIAIELGVHRATISRRISSGIKALRRKLKKVGIITTIPALGLLLAKNAEASVPASVASALDNMAISSMSEAATATVSTTSASTAAATVAGTKLAAIKMLVAAIGVVATITGAGLVTYRLAKPSRPPAIRAEWPFDESEARRRQQKWADYLGIPVEQEFDLGDGTMITMVLIPPGDYVIFKPDNSIEEALRKHAQPTGEISDTATAQRPFRRMRITHPFLISKTEVTVKQFTKFVEKTDHMTEAEMKGDGMKADANRWWRRERDYSWFDPGFDQREAYPVVFVSWSDTQAFCKWAGETINLNMTLPTEAQWEYACRAGTDTYFVWGDAEEDGEGWGNFADEGLGQQDDWAGVKAFPWDDGFPHTAPVGSFRANAFGLHDMHGNVAEWCQNAIEDDYYHQYPHEAPEDGFDKGIWRVHRPCSWRTSFAYSSSHYRIISEMMVRVDDLGFRVAAKIDFEWDETD